MVKEARKHREDKKDNKGILLQNLHCMHGHVSPYISLLQLFYLSSKLEEKEFLFF